MLRSSCRMSSVKVRASEAEVGTSYPHLANTIWSTGEVEVADDSDTRGICALRRLRTACVDAPIHSTGSSKRRMLAIVLRISAPSSEALRKAVKEAGASETRSYGRNRVIPRCDRSRAGTESTKLLAEVENDWQIFETTTSCAAVSMPACIKLGQRPRTRYNLLTAEQVLEEVGLGFDPPYEV